MNAAAPPRRRLAAWLVCAMLWPAAALASAITIKSVAAHLGEDGFYTLDAELELDFSADALEALDNGVPLIFRVTTRVARQRPLLWDETVKQKLRYYRLHYHALSDQYVLSNLTEQSQQSFLSSGSAIAALGDLDALRLINAQRLEHGEKYNAGLRVALDVEALPSPMRPWAWISNDWQLDSGWYTWQLK
jgi:hypothetical protein